MMMFEELVSFLLIYCYKIKIKLWYISLRLGTGFNSPVETLQTSFKQVVFIIPSMNFK